jgi:hypothetical protein
MEISSSILKNIVENGIKRHYLIYPDLVQAFLKKWWVESLSASCTINCKQSKTKLHLSSLLGKQKYCTFSNVGSLYPTECLNALKGMKSNRIPVFDGFTFFSGMTHLHLSCWLIIQFGLFIDILS